MRCVLILVLALAGCAEEQARTGEPLDLVFSSPFDYSIYRNRYHSITAVGGTQVITLYQTGIGLYEEPYTASIKDGESHVIEKQDGPYVTIRAVRRGYCALKIVAHDGAVAGDAFQAETVTKLGFTEPFSPGTFSPPTEILEARSGEVAWLPGDHRITIGLLGDGGTAGYVDAALMVSMPGAQQIGFGSLQIVGATVGTHPITVVGAGQTRTVDLVVVDRADSIRVVDGPTPVPTSLTPGQRLDVCFEGLASGRHIMGLGFTITATGPYTYLQTTSTCISVASALTSGTMTVTATTGSESLELTFPIGPP